MKKIKLLICAVLPIVAAVSLIGLTSFTDDDEAADADAIKGKKISGDLPCGTMTCAHPDGVNEDGSTHFTLYSITGAVKRDCISAEPSDKCKRSDVQACHGGSCSSGQALPH